MKIFENGQFVELPKEHGIYQLFEAVKARIVRDKNCSSEDGDENDT